MEKLHCKHCEGCCVKNGLHSNGKQRYKCQNCGKKQLKNYTYNAYEPNLNQNIISLTKEGFGIRSLARYLKISPTTVLKRILAIAKTIQKPMLFKNKTYEVDELCTYIQTKKRRTWICYALERESQRIVNFKVGSRSLKTLRHVVENLTLSKPNAIYTDGLKSYQTLILTEIHKTSRFGTNHIERMNLTLRTHLKRL